MIWNVLNIFNMKTAIMEATFNIGLQLSKICNNFLRSRKLSFRWICILSAMEYPDNKNQEELEILSSWRISYHFVGLLWYLTRSLTKQSYSIGNPKSSFRVSDAARTNAVFTQFLGWRIRYCDMKALSSGYIKASMYA